MFYQRYSYLRNKKKTLYLMIENWNRMAASFLLFGLIKWEGRRNETKNSLHRNKEKEEEKNDFFNNKLI